MAFQREFTYYSVVPAEGSMKGPMEDSTKGPMEGYMKGPMEDSTKGASQDFLLSKCLTAGLSEHLKVVLPFLL